VFSYNIANPTEAETEDYLNYISVSGFPQLFLNYAPNALISKEVKFSNRIINTESIKCPISQYYIKEVLIYGT